MKEMISKILFWGSWYVMIVMIFIATAVICLPMTIYGLINGVGLKETLKGHWVEGFYKEVKTQTESFKGIGL